MNPDMKIYYFAYGSNMSSKRFYSRVPDAKDCGNALLSGYEFVCNKRSQDGSSKGNIFPREDASTWGVIYEIPTSALETLDKAEKGYRRISVSVYVGCMIYECETYISTEIIPEKPFDWYMAYIVEGAREHHLPEEYIQRLSEIPMKADRREKHGHL